MTSVDEDPKRLVEMYAQFVEVRQKFLLANTADYPEFVQQGWFNLFLWAVHDEVYGIANKINKFWRQLHSLAAWNIILPSLNEVDQYNALVEFVSPTADDCLTAPYSIKSALVTSVCRISHQTKLRSNKDYREILDAKKRLRFPDAEKLAKGYENWPDLKEAFSKLNNDDYKSESQDYRNKINHELEPNIGMGERFNWERLPESDESQMRVSYGLGKTRSLSLDKIVPTVTDQYKAALECFERYVDLVREQYDIWTKPNAG